MTLGGQSPPGTVARGSHTMSSINKSGLQVT